MGLLYKIPPWEHQLNVINKTLDEDYHALFFEQGCISHDAELVINVHSNSFFCSIEKLYRVFNGVDLKDKEKKLSGIVKIQACKGKEFEFQEIRSVIQSGVKEVGELRIDGHTPLKLTADHEVLTIKGWVKAGNLVPGIDLVACNKFGLVTFKEVLSYVVVGKEMTYDVVCHDPWRNFSANGIVVHNCGKTPATINILRHKCAQRKRILRTLVFCPPVVVAQWKKEFTAHSKLAPWVVTLTGSGKNRCKVFREKTMGFKVEKDIPTNPFIFITNYEALLMQPLMKLFMDYRFEFLVCDESQKLKNHKSKKTKLCFQIADVARYRFILTGTPILNNSMDIFSQYRILDRGERFGKNFFLFRSKYFYDKNAMMPKERHFPNWVPREAAHPELVGKIESCSTRAIKSECLDLPPLVRQTIHVPLGPEQKRMYKDMKNDLITFLKDDACIAETAMTKALRLMQIVSGFVKMETGEEIVFEDNPRIDALKELIEQIPPTEKIIIWASFKKNYEMVRRVCEDLKIKHTELHGNVAAKDRDENIRSFQEDKDVRIMCANQMAGGVGVNLTQASFSIYLSRNFSLEGELQSEARNYRGGSEMHEKVTRIDIISPGTIDEHVVEALSKKQIIADHILNWKDKL